jgi:hypothetical protein
VLQLKGRCERSHEGLLFVSTEKAKSFFDTDEHGLKGWAQMKNDFLLPTPKALGLNECVISHPDRKKFIRLYPLLSAFICVENSS